MGVGNSSAGEQNSFHTDFGTKALCNYVLDGEMHLGAWIGVTY